LERQLYKLKLVVLISQKESILRKIKEFIPEDYILLEGEPGPKGLQLLGNIVSGVILVDTSIHGIQMWIGEALRLRADLTYLGIADRAAAENFPFPLFYDFISPPFNSRQVSSLLERAWERGQLNFELKTLKKNPGGNDVNSSLNSSSSHRLKEHVLCEFSRALSNNFNRNRLLELFMDAVAELVPVGKLSLLLFNENLNKFIISAQRGLDPLYCSGLLFNPSSGLLAWLTGEGRILRTEEAAGFAKTSSEVLQEMKLLQAVVCIPLVVHGQLVGTLNLGPKVTGSLFSDDELEVLYILSGNVAMALRDIELHHQIRYQKYFIENILQRMNSGVIAINQENLIITFNYRAGKILSFQPEEVMGKDLRCLPSPLGDLLYDTLTMGRVYHKEEIILAFGHIPLEFSTYQLLDEERAVAGSVMIFDDISERKQLEVERRQADQLDVLNKFVGQLAHEIKNPMVAIQTFCELLPEKYEDSSFRDFFTHTVRQEVQRLNELVEQLIAFSTSLSYKFMPVEIHETLDRALLMLQEQGKGQKTSVNTSYSPDKFNIRADKILLARSFSYLLRNSFQAMEKGGSLFIHTFFDGSLFENGGVGIHFWDSETKTEISNVEKLFNPLCARESGYISLELPVCRKIIEDHGGHVRASLTKDKYLKFEVYLPIFSGEGGENVAT